MNVLITGAGGFIGKNLFSNLSSTKGVTANGYFHGDSLATLKDIVGKADWIVHLAGVNRPDDVSEFKAGNSDLTSEICNIASKCGKQIPIIFSSSIQAGNDTPYGKSKLEAEEHLKSYSVNTGSQVYIMRLPNVMGKWCRPNYNSAVATFCHNIARDLPIHVDDENKIISLNYIDDLVAKIKSVICGHEVFSNHVNFLEVEPVYEISLKFLVNTLVGFREGRPHLEIDQVGSGLIRALYATYISYLDESDFSYTVESHTDDRGTFVEFLKTKESGQISYLTAKPGVTRGRHYHNTKTEKFLVVQGEALFRYRQLHTEQYFEISVSAANPTVVESIPGWAHDVTNTGHCDLIILLWSSEVFDKDKPDTIPSEI
jgi:UDP-2-acetamido-2,6-beta-L-arabino-hexul-4-ose reductase